MSACSTSDEIAEKRLATIEKLIRILCARQMEPRNAGKSWPRLVMDYFDEIDPQMDVLDKIKVLKMIEAVTGYQLHLRALS